MRQDVTGGAGKGVASADYLWWPPHKVSGHYLATLLDQQGEPRGEILPPSRAVDIEVPFRADWHRDPTGLDPYSPPLAP